MPKILVNFVYNKEKDSFTILDEKCVYADMPYAIKEQFNTYTENYVVPINGKLYVVDKHEFFKKNKLYKFNVTEGNKLVESDNGKIKAFLPRNGFNINDLVYINGQILLQSIEKGE